MPRPNKQIIDESIVSIELPNGQRKELAQSDLVKLHKDHAGSKSEKDQVVIDHLKVAYYELMGGVPSRFDVELDDLKKDGTVKNITIE